MLPPSSDFPPTLCRYRSRQHVHPDVWLSSDGYSPEHRGEDLRDLPNVCYLSHHHLINRPPGAMHRSHQPLPEHQKLLYLCRYSIGRVGRFSLLDLAIIISCIAVLTFDLWSIYNYVSPDMSIRSVSVPSFCFCGLHTDYSFDPGSGLSAADRSSCLLTCL